METICNQCQRTFKTKSTKPNRISRFCSKNCYTLFQKKNIKLWGVNSPNFPEDRKKLAIEKARKKNIGKAAWNKGKKRTWDSPGAFKKGEHLDEKHPRWKGGHIVYWRKKALERDNYTCRVCHLKEPEIMEVAHLKPINGNKNRELSGNKLNKLDNLVTLCPNDHKRYDKSLLNNKILNN